MPALHCPISIIILNAYISVQPIKPFRQRNPHANAMGLRLHLVAFIPAVSAVEPGERWKKSQIHRSHHRVAAQKPPTTASHALRYSFRIDAWLGIATMCLNQPETPTFYIEPIVLRAYTRPLQTGLNFFLAYWAFTPPT